MSSCPKTARLARAFVLSAAAAASHAQTTAPVRLEPVTVTGNPLRSAETAAPVVVLGGDELVLRRGSTLGETLAGQPGVSSSWFGPNADRPVIRGLDGDRVRMLSNAGASLDASSLSFDHAVPIDPLVVERIEVLRGPASLLYGGSAVGGAVNAIDNRIPRAPVTALGGAAELRFGGAARERSGAALVEAGNGRFALHADAFGRETSDLAVPRFTPLEDGTPLPETTRVRNSASRASGGALGGSVTFAGGHVGLAADRYDSRYGIVAEPDVIIRMAREQVALGGEWRRTEGLLRALRVRLGDTRYRHEEVEGDGTIGTTFRTGGQELRVEAEHAPLGLLRGVVGVQAERSDFSALGEEAFVPTTRTRRAALFVVEEAALGAGVLSAGARLERVRVASDGDADPADPRFGPPQERRFSIASLSLAHLWRLGGPWSVATTLARSERAPTSFELYANGEHAATGAYERGDPALERERGTQLDLALQWRDGEDHLRAGVFAAHFADFIALEATGADVNGAPEYRFRAVAARLAGVEVEGRRRLVSAPWRLDLSGKLDLVHGTNRSTGEALPRLPPLRVSLALDAGSGPWTLRAELEHAARQGRVPATDVPTPGYTLLHAGVWRRVDWGGTDALLFARLSNVTDRLGFSATTIRTVRDLSPLPGRALRAGVRVAF